MTRRLRIDYRVGDVVVSKFSAKRLLVTGLSPDGYVYGVWIGNVDQPEFPGARERAHRVLAGKDMAWPGYNSESFVNENPAERDLFEQVRA